MFTVNTPKSKSDEEQTLLARSSQEELEDQYLLDESFDELQTEDNWREFNFPVEDYY